jgi:hypothetical protein
MSNDVDIVLDWNVPVWVDWVYVLIPPAYIQRLLINIFVNLDIWSHDFGYYFADKRLQPYLILTYVDNVPYSFVPGLSRKFVYFFTELVPDGAFKVMKISSCDRAVHVENSSRLSFDTSGQPIPAANSVSLEPVSIIG